MYEGRSELNAKILTGGNFTPNKYSTLLKWFAQGKALTKGLIKYGICHILGNGQTGKSTIAEHFNMIMPRLAENLDKMADSTSSTDCWRKFQNSVQ